MFLLGPFIFIIKFEEKTDNTVNCLIRLRLLSIWLTVSLATFIMEHDYTIGPSIDHCMVPSSESYRAEHSLPTSTLVDLPFSHSLIKLSRSFGKPVILSLNRLYEYSCPSIQLHN